MPKIRTIPQFAEKNPAFTVASLRWQIFKANENGLADSGALMRNGRRVLIDEDKFFAWFESRQTTWAPAPRKRTSARAA